ncbi:hypothetical protein RI129_010464 [Pyrocoelia pectoralis]|uniref:Ionotropic glutamate receptor C-terminal domain-containing protein n=1 Tax=Pyrocoelia pectoralis TaxID=417401 RepID=A0AAN7ZH32_9COLE
MCGKNPQLIELDTCAKGVVINNVTLFDNKLPETYDNCTIPTIAMKYPPFVINETEGFEIKVLNEVGKILHINFGIKMIEDAADWGVRLAHNNWSGPLEAVYRESAIAIGNIIPNPEYDADFDLSTEYYRERMVWVVPTALPIERWKNLFVIFSYELWLVNIAFYIAASSLLYLTSKWAEEFPCYQDLSTNFLFSLEILLAIAVPKQPKTYAARSVFISLAVYSILIIVMYQTLLMSHLLNPVYEKQISSFEDVINSKIRVGGIRRYKEFFNDSSDEKTSYIYDIFETYKLNDTALNWLLTVANQRDTCTISSQFYVKYVTGKRESVFVNKWGDVKILTLKDLIFTYPIRMILPRGFPLGSMFDIVIWKLNNGGIVREWAKRYEQQHQHYHSDDESDDSNDTVLTVYHLQGAFLLLLFGYAFSILAFILEILVHKVKNFRKRR